MSWSIEDAAQVMGMPAHEVLAVAEVGDVHVVTTHDGQHTVVTADGAARLAEPHELEALTAPAETQADAPDGGVDPAAGTDPDAVPDGKAEDVLAWVGEDKDRAARALTAEKAKDKPRAGVVSALEKATQA